MADVVKVPEDLDLEKEKAAARRHILLVARRRDLHVPRGTRALDLVRKPKKLLPLWLVFATCL